MQFVATDLPDEVSTKPFSTRLKELKDISNHYNFDVAEFIRCNNKNHLREIMQASYQILIL